MATSNTGPVKLTFDNTPARRRARRPARLHGGPGRARLRRRLESRREPTPCSVRSSATSAPEARTDAVGYLDKVWAADPWSRGCYTGYMPPGVLLGWGTELRMPVGRIHWAGTETATAWAGYMDGAIESGQRAAAEVLAAL